MRSGLDDEDQGEGPQNEDKGLTPDNQQLRVKPGKAPATQRAPKPGTRKRKSSEMVEMTPADDELVGDISQSEEKVKRRLGRYEIVENLCKNGVYQCICLKENSHSCSNWINFKPQLVYVLLAQEEKEREKKKGKRKKCKKMPNPKDDDPSPSTLSDVEELTQARLNVKAKEKPKAKPKVMAKGKAALVKALAKRREEERKEKEEALERVNKELKALMKEGAVKTASEKEAHQRAINAKKVLQLKCRMCF